MKRTICVSIALMAFLSIIICEDALSWDDGVTHKDLSEYAAYSSVLRKCKNETDLNCDYLKNLGFNKGLDKDELEWNENVTIKRGYIRDWLREGAKLEDAYTTSDLLNNHARFNNHFHNPLKLWENAGLDDYVIIHVSGKSSLLWAQDGAYQETFTERDWSWQKIRDYYYLALTSTTETQRQGYFARTFKGLGHQMHLIQDAAVPEHDRNDAHPSKRNKYGSLTIEAWAAKEIPDISTLKTFAPEAKIKFPVLPNPSVLILDPSYYNKNLASSALFLDTDQYDSNNPSQFFTSNLSTSLSIGLAEYTNANFVSDDTIFVEERSVTDRHYFPYPRKSSTNLQDLINKNILLEAVIAEDGVTEPTLHIKKDKDGEIIEHFVKPKYTTTSRWDLVGGGTIYELDFYRDEKCHEDYASLLIPRAVGYSAGLLNYFFRGTLEITSPDQFVYAIADGSSTPHQFTKIKAKVRNTTSGEAIQSGTLQAVAKYKKRTDYQTDLSTDPPTPDSRESDYSYSVSSSIAINSLDSTTGTEFTFDFTNNPIPAGITDLYLNIIFKGTIGNETGNAIAVGMKDLDEPTHISTWNSTDRFYLDGVLRTADEIRNDSTLLSRVDHDGNGIPDEQIDPYEITVKLAFSSTSDTPTTYPITYSNMPAGRYGRIIILTDTGTTSTFYMHGRDEAVNNTHYPYEYYYIYYGVTNQEEDGVFTATDVNTFRGVTQHKWNAVAEYYPDYSGIETAPWPTPADTTPYAATKIE